MAADLKIFAFDPREYREAYETQGWLHVPNGLTDSFLATLSEFATASFGDHRVEGAAIGGRKEQALYEFQDRAELEELFDAISSICDLMRPSMTLSERHIKAYDADAPPDPPAHKDRYASQVSVGFSIDITRGSRLVLYPDDHRELNPFNISAALRANLEPEELPEAILPGAREVEIEDTAGDVVIFPGSSMWHLRRNPAGVVNLYLKFNDFDCDPLGEDPSTPERRGATLAALDHPAPSFRVLVPTLGRRFDSVIRRNIRGQTAEIIQLDVWGQEPVGITDVHIKLLEAIDGRKSVLDILEELARGGIDEAQATRALRRLAECGAVDLLDRRS
jgi:hypothetical protein